MGEGQAETLTSLTVFISINHDKLLPLEVLQQLQVGPRQLAGVWVQVH